MVTRPPRTPLGGALGNSRFSTNRRSKRKLIAFLSIAVLIPFVATTLATTITINGRGGSTAIEFGQGSQVAVACDTTILTSVSEAWDSVTNHFDVTSINFDGVNLNEVQTATSSNQGCGGHALKIDLIKSSGQAPIGYNGTNAVNGPVTILLPHWASGPSPYTGGTPGDLTFETPQLLGGTSQITCDSVDGTNCKVVFTLNASLVGSLGVNPEDVTRVGLETD